MSTELPKKVVAAGMLFHDERGRALLVEPTYKPLWEIPGGVVEARESPSAGARREVLEEIGLDITPGRLLALDYSPPRDGRKQEVQIIVFDGGRLSDDQLSRIRLQEDEIASYRFVEIAEAERLLAPILARRVKACLEALKTGETLYLEDGMPLP